MKILIIDTFYGPYLESIYINDIATKSWKEQHIQHFKGGFGTGNSYSVKDFVSKCLK